MTAPRIEKFGNATLHLANCRAILPTLAGIDLVCTDPPYSSGGAFRSDRNQKTSIKYQLSNTQRTHPEFSGDNRDQRSFMFWCVDWMEMCLQAMNANGVMFCFIDWRQLPCLADSVQVAGWVYRGIVPWDKTEASRPQKGWFRSQCEYIVTASAGALPVDYNSDEICAPGFIRVPVETGKKIHCTQKPLPLIEYILGIRRGWDTVLDPFMGSGTTGIAVLNLGKKFIGIEIDESNFDNACKRIEAASKNAPRLMPAHEAIEAPEAEREAAE